MTGELESCSSLRDVCAHVCINSDIHNYSLFKKTPPSVTNVLVVNLSQYFSITSSPQPLALGIRWGEGAAAAI